VESTVQLRGVEKRGQEDGVETSFYCMLMMLLDFPISEYQVGI